VTFTGLIWLRIGTDGGLLWTRKLTLAFRKIRGMCWLTEDRLGFFSRKTLLHGVSVVNLTFCSAVGLCSVAVCDAVCCSNGPFAVFTIAFGSNR